MKTNAAKLSSIELEAVRSCSLHLVDPPLPPLVPEGTTDGLPAPHFFGRFLEYLADNTEVLMCPRGGFREGAGRPPADDPATERMMVRLTPAEAELVKAAASLDGELPSTWARHMLVKAAEARVAKGGR